VANTEGRPIAFVLTPGNVADISVADCLLADKAYDANHLRKSLEAQGTEVVIPSNRTRRTNVWAREGLATDRNMLRPLRHELPLRRRPRRNRLFLTCLVGPST
jgi:transposase